MIRINLLGTPKPKGKKGPAFSMPSMDFNVGSPMMQVAAVLIIAGLLNAGVLVPAGPREEADRGSHGEGRAEES